jgi:hypothetical protein
MWRAVQEKSVASAQRQVANPRPKAGKIRPCRMRAKT